MAFEAGGPQIVEAAGNRVVGIPMHGFGHPLPGTAPSREEAVVIAAATRLANSSWRATARTMR